MKFAFRIRVYICVEDLRCGIALFVFAWHIEYRAFCSSKYIFQITAYRAELVFRLVPAINLDAILNKNIGLISVFLLQIRH